ncbi:MAG: hypothetical protein LC731_01410 [Acidobacteria bacterium]|nr:hypothetical protein [Acidobacteriota bacterium]
MARFSSPLDNVRVAAPCTSDWNQMVGDERVRFCKHCSMNVYNLSSMTRREAESLISNAEGRLCIRYYRRQDGTILTNNCPVGLRAIKRRLKRVANATLSAVLSFFAGLGVIVALPDNEVSVLNLKPISLSEPGVREPDTFPAMTGTYDVMEGKMELQSDTSMGSGRTVKRIRKAKRR